MEQEKESLVNERRHLTVLIYELEERLKRLRQRREALDKFLRGKK